MSDKEKDEGMEVDEDKKQFKPLPPSLTKQVGNIDTACKVYSAETGDEDAVGPDRDVADKDMEELSPEGVTELGGQSDEEVLALKQVLSQPAPPTPRSVSKTRKGRPGLSTPLPIPSSSRPTPMRGLFGRLDSNLPQADKQNKLSVEEETKLLLAEEAARGRQPITALVQHPLFEAVDVDDELGFSVWVTPEHNNPPVPDPLYLLRAMSSKGVASRQPIPDYPDQMTTFPITTSRSWIGAANLMLATIDKMGKLFELPEFKVTYDKSQMAFIIEKPKEAPKSPATLRGQPGMTQLRFDLASKTLDTTADPTPAKVPKIVSFGKSSDPRQTSVVTVASIPEPPTQVRHDPMETQPAGDLRNQETTPGPTDGSTPTQDQPVASTSSASAPAPAATECPPHPQLGLPQACVAGGAFGGAVELDVLRFVSPSVVQGCLERWPYRHVYMLSGDPVIKQLCAFMAVGRQDVYGTVEVKKLQEFIALLEATPP